MPNDPLQTFRYVEPANWGFGATSTMASQPFVLYHDRVSIGVGTGTPGSNIGPSWSSLGTNRFYPWVQRTLDRVYPVKVPNAYDRIYIHPVFAVDTDDTANFANVNFTAPTTTFVMPFIIPFGLLPETRGYSTANKFNAVDGTRFPDDLLVKAGAVNYPSSQLATRTNGHWLPLPAYASNFSTNSGVKTAGGDTNPTHYGRAANSAGTSTGTGYQLPNDFTISASGSAALSTSATAAATTQYISGQGAEFATMGTEEIVVSLGSNPAGVLMNHPGTVGQIYYANFFLVGCFLG
jgi:hypothetical protein